MVPFVGAQPDLAVVGAADVGLDGEGVGAVVEGEGFRADCVGGEGEWWVLGTSLCGSGILR